MDDSEFITAIAQYWIELGGDTVGFDFLQWKLRDKIDELEHAETNISQETGQDNSQR